MRVFRGRNVVRSGAIGYLCSLAPSCQGNVKRGNILDHSNGVGFRSAPGPPSQPPCHRVPPRLPRISTTDMEALGPSDRAVKIMPLLPERGHCEATNLAMLSTGGIFTIEHSVSRRRTESGSSQDRGPWSAQNVRIKTESSSFREKRYNPIQKTHRRDRIPQVPRRKPCLRP